MPTYEQEKKKTVQRTAPRAWDSSQLPPERQTNTQQTSQKWYAGENPTWRETLAQIYKVSGDDKQKRTSLYNKYNAMRQDPTSVLYDPYTQATTTRQNTTNINTTNKALREWDDLSRELSFWATSSRNYSDDEIIANIDWKKYPTLAKMDAGRESGKPIALLTSVGYSKDAMYGVIWGARNPDQKSDNLEMDAVKSVLGRGNTYKRDENIAQRLNKASSTYAPYTVGGTMDDLMVKYGTETFDDKWLEDNAYMKLDPDMADDYATIYYAHQNTKELQKMAEEWKNDVLREIEKGVSIDDIFDEEELASDYNKLYNLLESQRSGRLVNTTAAIDFDWEGMKKVAADAYLKKNGTLSTTEYEQQMNDLTGGTHKQSDVDAEIENGWLLNTDILGKQDMTPAESKAFKAKASAGYSDVVFTAADGVANGTGGYAEMQRGLINEANALAGKNLLNVMRGLAEGNRNTLADFVPEQDLKALQEYFPEQYAEGRLPTQEEFNAKRAESSEDPSKEDFWFDFEAQIYSLWNTEAIVSQERDQTAQYQEQLAEIEDAVAEAYGGKDTDQYRAFFASYEYAWDIVNQPDTFDEYDAFQRATMAEGFDSSKSGDYLMSYAGNAGSDVLKAQAALENAKKMGMDAEAITALEKDLAKKQKNLALVNAHYLTANKDYSPQVKAFDEAYNDGTVTAAAGEHSAEVLAAVVNPEAAQDFAIANRYGKPGQAGMYTALLETAELSMVMTGEERSNYKYLYATKGEEAATAYFDALSENLIVRKSVQDSEARQEWAGENVGNAILATVGSIAVSPVTALEGVVNTLSALFGKDLNPHKDFKVAMAQSDLRTGVKDGVAEAADNEIVSGIFNAVYDAVTSAGDTLIASTTGGAWTMALSAMNSSMMDARMRGADTKTALAYGAANAVIELGTEKLGMDRIADAFKKKGAGGVRELLGEMLSGFANEFGEETVGNIAGQLTDDLIMGNLSNYNNAVQQYMSIGLSEEAAKAQAARDSLKEILYGGLVGGLSGGLTSGIGFVAGSVAGKNNPTKAPQKPAEAPVEQTPPVYQGTEKERAVSALSAAQGEGVGEVKQQATVQGVLQGLGVSAQESSAAAKMIMDNAGMKMAQWLIAKSDNPQDIAKALTFAQLVPQSRSAAVLMKKVNSNNAKAIGRELLEAYKVDSADSKNVEQYEAAVHESALADAAVEILEKEGSEAIAKANRDKKDREQEKREKTRDFRMKNAAAENAANALKEASAAVAQDASPENIKRQSEANKELQKAKSAREQARVAMEEANTKAKDAAEVEKKVVRNAQNSARMQAQQYVAKETEQRKAAEAEKAATADAKRQNDNVLEMEFQNYLAEEAPNATPEQVEQLRKDFFAASQDMQSGGTTVEPDEKNKRLGSALSKRFGVNVEFADLGGKFKGAFNRSTGTIVLDKNLTQGEAIFEVALHELTHRAESGGLAYNAYASNILDIAFKGDKYKLKQEIEARMQRYNDRFAEMAVDGSAPKGAKLKPLTYADAKKELVADLTRKVLYGDEALITQLVESDRQTAYTFLDWIKDTVKRLAGVKDPMADRLNHTRELFEKALDRSAERATRDAAHPSMMQFSIEQFARANGFTTVRNSEGQPYAILDDEGNEVKEVTAYMVKNAPIGRLIQTAQKNGTIDEKTAGEQYKMFAKLMTMVAQHKDQAMIWEIAGSELFSAIKSNADPQYSTTVDFGTICSKTREVVNVMSETMLKKGRGLTREEVIDAYNNTHKAGMAVPCPVCYVFSRWMGVPSLLETMRKGQERFANATDADVNAYLKSVAEKYGIEGKELSESVGKAKSKVQKKLKKISESLLKGVFKKGENEAALIEQAKALEAELDDIEMFNWVNQVLCKTDRKRKPILDKDGNVTIDPSYKAVPNEVLLDLRRTGEFASDYAKSWTFRTTRGNGMGKAILPYSGAELGDTISGVKRWAASQNPYFTGDDKAAAKKMKSAQIRAKIQNLIGGHRFQSTSDYRPEWGLDYLSTFLEMQAIGAKGQLYTKVIEAVDMFATAGIEVNLSIMPKGNGYHKDANGNPVLTEEDFSNVTGIDFKGALEKAQKYDNVQMILVGINDTHIELAMADDRIGFIIPWHSSGNSKDTLSAMMTAVGETLTEVEDYTDIQTDKVSENQTPEQKAAWDLRINILTGKLKNGVSADQQKILDGNPYLKALYEKFYVDSPENKETYGVKLSKAQASQIFPHEYWDTQLKYDQADQNGKRFVEYCQSMGIEPRFGKFADKKGYWKLLIDRKMYNNDGTYHSPKVIDVTKVKIGDVAAEVSQARNGTPEQISKAVQETIDNINARLPAEPFDGGVDLSDAQYSLADEDAKTPDLSNAQYSISDDSDVRKERMRAWMDARKNAPVEPQKNVESMQQQVLSGEPWETDQKKSQFATQTGQNTNVLTPETKQKLLADPYYTTTSEKKNLAIAVDHIAKDGYSKRRNMMLNGDTNMSTPAGQVEAYVLMKMAKESGDAEAEAALAFKVKESGTQIAQSLAMRRLYEQMSPAGKLKYVQKAVDKINADYEARGKDTRVELPEWLAGALEKADGDSVATEQALDDACREIAMQMPYSFKDWESTWRYLAMLGNPLSHVKNLLGVAAYTPYVATRNKVSALLQKSKPQEERTRTLGMIKKEYLDFAKVIAATQQKAMKGETATTSRNAMAKIEEYRQKGPKWMDKLSTFNSDAMAAEDLFWKNKFFTRSLASYLQAKGADLNDLSPEMLNGAIQHALDDAYRNTFNNVNQLAKVISGAERSMEKGGTAGKVLSYGLKSILPFKNTPSNVLARGVDFSPVGFAHALTFDLHKYKQGKMTADEYFDKLSAGLTGTGATVLGFALASMGFLNMDEDELTGEQENSITLLGVNIGIDWMGTAAMPVLMGGRLYQMWEEQGKEIFGDGFDLSDIPELITLFGEAMRGVTDPMINLSMLQGMNNFVKSAGYAGDNAISALGTRAATTYASQFVPSFFGAVARIADETRRTTYTDKNSVLPSDIQYFGQSIINKIPVLSWQGMPYMDAWGNEESNGPLWRRLLNNLLLPGYSRSIESPDEVEKMLADLYDTATAQNISGASDAKLKAAEKSFSVNGETYHMTAEEYEKMSKVRGRTAYDLLQQLMQQEEFYNGSDYYKVKAVGYVWDYANTIAKHQINADYAPDSAKWALTTKDPFGSVMEKAASATKNYENDQLRLALYDAIRDGRSDEIHMYQEALIENGVKESGLKTSITNEFKSEWLFTYEEDPDAALGLEYSLRETGLFRTKDFTKWMKGD